jgi:transcriptional regulator with XRE-family HTH domain
MDSFSSFMKLIKAARALADLSQDELASAAGVSRQIVVRVENGDESVTIEALEKIRVACEKNGVLFLGAGEKHGVGVALKSGGQQRDRG